MRRCRPGVGQRRRAIARRRRHAGELVVKSGDDPRVGLRRRVLIDESRPHRVVTHPGHEVPCAHAAAGRQRVAGVPQIVQPDPRQASGRQGIGPAKGLADLAPPHRSALRAGEDERGRGLIDVRGAAGGRSTSSSRRRQCRRLPCGRRPEGAVLGRAHPNEPRRERTCHGYAEVCAGTGHDDRVDIEVGELLGQFGAEEAIGCRLPHDDVVTVDADPGVELAAGGVTPPRRSGPRGCRWPDRPVALGGAARSGCSTWSGRPRSTAGRAPG